MQEKNSLERQMEPDTAKETEIQKEMSTLRRELKINRIFSGAACVLMLCIIIGGGVLWSRFGRYAKEAEPLIEQLAHVDYQQLNEAVEKLEVTLDSVDWEELSRQLSAVDVEALNQAIEGLDTKELTEALENLNKAVESVQNFTGKLFGK